ncbi:Phosphoglycerate mutase [[Candida] zeylanoides]
MSLLVPNERDYADAHGDLDQDDEFFRQRRLRNIKQAHWDFEPVHGFFLQSAAATPDMAFNYVEQDFGRIAPDWSTFAADFAALEDTDTVKYKVLFLARHGQGWHNVASHKYPAHEWSQKWRHLGTDGELVWGPDAQLTPLGLAQAAENNAAWTAQLSRGAPQPSKFYVSPLSRSGRTLCETWRGIEHSPPVVAEGFRETIGVHLCHKRSRKSQIRRQFPHFVFEPGFPEEDELFARFTPAREELHQQFMRVHEALERVFDQDERVVSITSHAGTIRAALTAIGHRKFTVPTGGMVPVVVRAKKAKSNIS